MTPGAIESPFPPPTWNFTQARSLERAQKRATMWSPCFAFMRENRLGGLLTWS